MPQRVRVYDAASDNDLLRAQADLEAAIAAFAARKADLDQIADEPTPAVATNGAVRIPPDPTLIGIDPEVFRQIEDALRAGKRHLMFYGPPGTGKTTLASYVASHLSPGPSKLITGSADWSSQDIIGGYQPVGSGLEFFPGVLLENFDRPLIIDELNRCDIDKVLGPLFTVLSGHATGLPYLVDASDKKSPRYVILPEPKAQKGNNEFAPTADWRLLATINSIDKASLYQMSYALSRRFAWILIDVPVDLRGFITQVAARERLGAPNLDSDPVPLADVWAAVNEVRRMGAAPFLDAIRACTSADNPVNLFSLPDADSRAAYVRALGAFVFPLLDGILPDEAERLGNAIVRILTLDQDATLADRVRNSLMSGAV